MLPRWSPLLMAIQHLNLRMEYKSKTKFKAKLMRSMRKNVPRRESIRWEPRSSQSRHINLRLHLWTESNEPIYRPEIKETKEKTNSVTRAELKALASVSNRLSRRDITQSFTKQTYGEGNVMIQCMNAICSHNRKIAETKRVLKLPIHSRLANHRSPYPEPRKTNYQPKGLKQLKTIRRKT
jgi:hypothetical protein